MKALCLGTPRRSTDKQSKGWFSPSPLLFLGKSPPAGALTPSHSLVVCPSRQPLQKFQVSPGPIYSGCRYDGLSSSVSATQELLSLWPQWPWLYNHESKENHCQGNSGQETGQVTRSRQSQGDLRWHINWLCYRSLPPILHKNNFQGIKDLTILQRTINYKNTRGK